MIPSRRTVAPGEPPLREHWPLVPSTVMYMVVVPLSGKIPFS